MSKLIIVESPHKAKTISKILGTGYIVKATLGHIRDLDTKDISVNLETLTPQYKNLPKKTDTIKELKKLSASASETIIASDPDREGEAIAWHVEQALNLKDYKRAEFHEITEKGIKEGLSHTRLIDKKLVAAQEARRVLDRFIGYGTSPRLMQNIDGAKSAGRVQTAALRIIVERENEILNFKPEKKYRVELNCSQQGIKFIAGVARTLSDNKNTLFTIDNEQTANKIKSEITGKTGDITNIESKQVKKNPPAPFTTSSFQQTCNTVLGLSPEDAMKIAQTLYDDGFITYMRTDAVRIADEAVDMAQEWIIRKYGEKYFEKHIYKNKDGSQDAHEAIRPASLEEPDVKGKEMDVYNLIKQRFLASLMSAAVFDQTVITVSVGNYIALSKSSMLHFDGYKKLYPFDDEKEKAILPVKKDKCNIDEINIKDWLTQPLARFTESSIIKELEDKGIGRPSTYAKILEKLKIRNYITVNKKQINPTQLGKDALKFLLKDFDSLFDISYTAKVESRLDEIAQGKAGYKNTVSELYNFLKSKNIDFNFEPSSAQIALAEKLAAEHSLKLPEDYKTDGKVCKEFIDKVIKENPFKPTEKQVSFAEKLAQEQGIDLPDGYKDNADICSKFISKYLGKGDKNGRPQGNNFAPSEKQIAFAEKLAEEKGVKLPKDYKINGKACKDFIDKAIKKRAK